MNQARPGPYLKSSPRVSLKRLQQKIDRLENAKVRERSGGQCEVVIDYALLPHGLRCINDATGGVHHMIGGRGKRGIGISALAEHKQHVCKACHIAIGGDIGGKKLIRVGGAVPHYTDRYRLVA